MHIFHSYIFIMCIIPFFSFGQTLLIKHYILNVAWCILFVGQESMTACILKQSASLQCPVLGVFFFHLILSFDVSVIQTFPFSKGKWFRQNLMWSILQVSMQQENSTVA